MKHQNFQFAVTVYQDAEARLLAFGASREMNVRQALAHGCLLLDTLLADGVIAPDGSLVVQLPDGTTKTYKL